MAAPPIIERHKHHFHRQSPIKESVRVATTANVTIATALNVGDTIDGVVLAALDRVLVKNQSSGAENGIYLAGASPVRDYDVSTDDPAFGFLVYVREGTANGGKVFKNTNTASPTIGTTALTFAEVGSASSLTVEESDGTPSVANVSTIVFDGATVTDDTGGQVTVTVTGGGSDLGIINVMDYGATGDGTTDDTAAINLAIADMTDGCTLYFPVPAVYYEISSTLSITAAGCRIMGAGSQYGTRIHMVTANTTAFSVIPSGLDGTRNQTNLIEHLLITGPGSATSGRGVYASSDVFLNDVGIAGFFVGLYWDNATFYSRMYGGFITNCVTGVLMNATNNCTLDTVRIAGDFGGGGLIGPMTDGVVLATALNRGLTNRIVNCAIEYYTGDGVRWNGGAGGELVGNYFETQQSASGKAHVRLGESQDTQSIFISGNYFQGDGEPGFVAIHALNTEGIVLGPNRYGINAAIDVDADDASNSRWFIMPQVSDPVGVFNWPASSYELDPDDPPLASGAAAGGDLSGTYPNPSVVDDSHSHTSATAPGGGELLLSSTASVPPVFGDILTNTDETDFVYSS